MIQLNFKIQESLKIALEAACAKAFQSQAEYIRQAILEKIRREAKEAKEK